MCANCFKRKHGWLPIKWCDGLSKTENYTLQMDRGNDNIDNNTKYCTFLPHILGAAGEELCGMRNQSRGFPITAFLWDNLSIYFLLRSQHIRLLPRHREGRGLHSHWPSQSFPGGVIREIPSCSPQTCCLIISHDGYGAYGSFHQSIYKKYYSHLQKWKYYCRSTLLSFMFELGGTRSTWVWKWKYRVKHVWPAGQNAPARWVGEGKPKADAASVCFNGSTACRRSESQRALLSAHAFWTLR